MSHSPSTVTKHLIRRVRHWFFALFLGCSLTVFGQGQADTVQLKSLLDETWYLIEEGSDAALTKGEEALHLAKKINNVPGQAEAHRLLGVAFRLQHKYDEALSQFFASLKILERTNDPYETASCKIDVGVNYHFMGDLQRSLEYLKDAARTMDSIGDPSDIGFVYNSIGLVYADSAQIASGQQSAELQEAAIVAYSRARENHIKAGEDVSAAYASGNIGDIYEQRGNYKKALQILAQQEAVFEQHQDSYGLMVLYNKQGNLHLLLGDAEKARKSQLRGLALATSTSNAEQRHYALHSLSQADSALGRWQDAYLNFKQYKALDDSLREQSSLERTAELTAAYESEKKEAQIKALQAEQEKQALLSEAEKSRNRTILTSVSGGLLLLLIFSFFMYNRWRITRQQKNTIEAQQVIVARQKQEVEEKNREITDSINYAKRLQEAILAPVWLVKETFPESFVIYKPKDIVAGDFYWLEKNAAGTFLAVADCTGHGVPGAMVSVVCSNALNQAVKEARSSDPGKILDQVRQLVIQTFAKSDSEVKDGMDIALVSIHKDEAQRKWQVQYAGANNPLWILRQGNPEVEVIKGNKQPIGNYDQMMPFETTTLVLNEGDTFYLSTDGLADQFGGERGKKLKSGNLKNFLLAMQDSPMHLQQQKLDAYFEQWKGSMEQVDDVCVVGVRV